jgi:hypothetical protein
MNRLRYSGVALAEAAFSLMLLLLPQIGTPPASARDQGTVGASRAGTRRDKTKGVPGIPRVYSAQNTGARFPRPHLPSFGRLPIIRPLPDPFRFFSGQRNTSFASWERHRNQIMAAIEKYEIGPVPSCSQCAITARYVPPAASGGSGILTVRVVRNGKTVTLTSSVYLPQGMGKGPFPVLIPMTIASMRLHGKTIRFAPPKSPNYGSLPPRIFKNLPIATINYVSTQVARYCASGLCSNTKDPFYLLYPNLCAGACRGASNSGIYAAWTWGMDRLIDGIDIAVHQRVHPLPIEMKRLAVTGCSFAGKMALFAGAFDERVALTIAQESGGGGATSWRFSHQIEARNSVEDIGDTNYNWWAGQMKQFSGDNVYKLPVDQDELMDMVAPRALLETGNTEFYWLSNGSNYVASRATQRVYDTLGVEDRFGFYLDGDHAHCAVRPAEVPVIEAFVDKFMLDKADVNTDVHVYPNPADTVNYGYPIVMGQFAKGRVVEGVGGYGYYFPTIDYRRWTDWWGTHDPRFPDNWNTGGTVVASLKHLERIDSAAADRAHPGGSRREPEVRELKVHAGDTLKAGYELMMGGLHPAVTVSLVGGARISLDIACAHGHSYILSLPLPAHTYSIPAGDRRWLPSEDPFSPLNYQGSTTVFTGSRACSDGRVTNAYFNATGASEHGIANPGGPGFLTTDVEDPLRVRFHVLDSNSGRSSGYSSAVTVNWIPLTSSNGPNRNPVSR